MLSGCATTGFVDFTSIPGNVLPSAEYRPDWKYLYPGLEVTSRVQKFPSLAFSALRIDLEHPERDIFVTPGNEAVDSGSVYVDADGRKKNFSSRTASSFLEDFNCIAAINATPYFPFRIFKGFPQRAVGVVISDGILYSLSPEYAVFSLTEDKEMSFTEPPFNVENVSGVDQAAGGFFIILKDGENTGFKGKRNPLSIAGASRNGRYLFLAVIDGEDKNWIDLELSLSL